MTNEQWALVGIAVVFGLCLGALTFTAWRASKNNDTW
jgi:hypothetical protein